MKKVRKARMLAVFLGFVLSLCFAKPTPVGGFERYLEENPEVATKVFQECVRKAQNREIEDYRKEMERNKKFSREFQSRKAKRKSGTTSNKSKKNSKKLYLPNSIVHDGKRVMFSQSSYDYYSDNDSDEYLEKRFRTIRKEIKNKNINVGPEFNGEDGESSYIMGHNPGTMANISTLKVGDSVFVTDKHGKTFEYVIVDFVNHKNGYNFEYGSGSVLDYFYEGLKKEAIFIQFCINSESHTFLGYPKKDLKK